MSSDTEARFIPPGGGAGHGSAAADGDAAYDADLKAITATPVARAAGAVSLLAGFFTLLLSLQTYGMFRMRGFPIVGVVLLTLFGAALFVSGWKLLRMRGWAFIGATGAGALNLLFGLGWLVYLVMNGVVSLMAVGVPALSALAAILSGVSIGVGLRADAARARLRDHGFEAGN